MAVIPLTDLQQQSIDALVRAGRLEPVPVDLQRCASFLSQAAAALGDLPNVRHPQNTYNLAYDAAHDVGEAMLAAYGYRTMRGAGQQMGTATAYGIALAVWLFTVAVAWTLAGRSSSPARAMATPMSIGASTIMSAGPTTTPRTQTERRWTTDAR